MRILGNLGKYVPLFLVLLRTRYIKVFTFLAFVLNRNAFSLIAPVRNWVKSELFTLVSPLCKLSGKYSGSFPQRLNKSTSSIPWLVLFYSAIVYCSNRYTLHSTFSFLLGLSFIQSTSPPEFWAHFGGCSYYLAYSAFKIPLFSYLILPSPLYNYLLLSQLTTTSYVIYNSSVIPVL